MHVMYDGLAVCVDCAMLTDGVGLLPCRPQAAIERAESRDFSEVSGHAAGRRACEIAAAGGHSVLFVGAPGSGRTMLARRLTTILPEMTESEATAVAVIDSASGLARTRVGARPFRAPHHTASGPALAGCGAPVRPGEVTLAHHGVLFLDETADFRRGALEPLVHALRQGDARGMPARPALVAGACDTTEVERATRTLTFDLRVPLSAETRRDGGPRESSAEIRARVEAARTFAARRAPHGVHDPMLMHSGARTLAANFFIGQRAASNADKAACDYETALRVARTIADLGASDLISAAHMAEALCLVGGAS